MPSAPPTSIGPSNRSRSRNGWRGDEHLILRPMGSRAPFRTPPKDRHRLRVILELVSHAVESGKVGILGFQNDVVEVTRHRRPSRCLWEAELAAGGIHLVDPSKGVAVLPQSCDNVQTVTDHFETLPSASSCEHRRAAAATGSRIIGRSLIATIAPGRVAESGR